MTKIPLKLQYDDRVHNVIQSFQFKPLRLPFKTDNWLRQGFHDFQRYVWTIFRSGECHFYYILNLVKSYAKYPIVKLLGVR